MSLVDENAVAQYLVQLCAKLEISTTAQDSAECSKVITEMLQTAGGSLMQTPATTVAVPPISSLNIGAPETYKSYTYLNRLLAEVEGHLSSKDGFMHQYSVFSKLSK